MKKRRAPKKKTPMSAGMLKTLGLLGKFGLGFWMDSLNVRVAYYNADVLPEHSFESESKRIYLLWHEHILFPLYFYRNCNIAMLLSQHRDADVLETVAKYFGFGCVRGSTNRGGTDAIRNMIRASKSMHLTITPDGPRGPRRKLAPGAIFLASRLQLPIVLIGIGYDRLWRMNSWDSFAIPKYGARARGIASDIIHIPPKLDGDQFEQYGEMLESRLNFLNDEAERWAVSGETLLGESTAQAGPKSSILYYGFPRGAEIEK